MKGFWCFFALLPFLFSEQISALSGQDMVYLEELKIAHNKLFSCEAAFNTFITSAPVCVVYVTLSMTGLDANGIFLQKKKKKHFLPFMCMLCVLVKVLTLFH